MKELLETYSSVRLRMIEDKESNDPPSLKNISSNTLRLREVKPLVDGLGRGLPKDLREYLMPGIGPVETSAVLSKSSESET